MAGDGENEILEIQGQIAVMGFNDSEFEAIRNILSDLHEYKITLEEAVALARQILDGKQDYH